MVTHADSGKTSGKMHIYCSVPVSNEVHGVDGKRTAAVSTVKGPKSSGFLK